MEVVQPRSAGEGTDALAFPSSSPASSRQDVTIPLARVTTCGGLVIEVFHTIQPGPDGQPQPVYGPPDATWLAMKGASTALTLLGMLASQPRCFASKDWLSEKLGHPPTEEDEDGEGLKRLDNVVYLLRHLLFPPRAEETSQDRQLRRRLVAYQRASSESGPGYRLASMPLLWLDVVEIGAHLKRARRLEQFGEDGLSEWQAAYELAKQGSFLPQEVYSDWATWRRQEVEAQWWDCVQVLYKRYREQGDAGEEQALRILREYWLQHVTNEDALRPLLELLGKREWYGQAEEYYRLLCKALEEEGAEPDRRTQETIEFVRALQIQRKRMTSHTLDVIRDPVSHVMSQDIIDYSARNIVRPGKDSPEEIGNVVGRRDFLREALHISSTSALASSFDILSSDLLNHFSQALMKPLPLDEATSQYLEICTKQLWYNRQSAVLPSRDLYRPVNAHLQKMITLLEGSLLPTERTRLCSLLSQTAQLLGELSLDMGYYAQGKAFHQAALAAAQEAEDHFLTVISWGRISLACIYGRSYSEALISIQTARSLAEKHSTPMIRGWLAAIEAEIQAHLSQAALCLQALEHAERFDSQPLSPLENYLVRFDRSLLGGYQGVCFRVLSRSEHTQAPFFLQKAQSSLKEALTSLDPLFLQRKPTLLADLAVVNIYRQNIEEACALISQAAALATHLHLHKVIQRLVALREPLRSWKELAPVKALDAYLVFLSSQESGQLKKDFESDRRLFESWCQ